jgi:hypothetical protein
MCHSLHLNEGATIIANLLIKLLHEFVVDHRGVNGDVLLLRSPLREVNTDLIDGPLCEIWEVLVAEEVVVTYLWSKSCIREPLLLSILYLVTWRYKF